MELGNRKSDVMNTQKLAYKELLFVSISLIVVGLLLLLFNDGLAKVGVNATTNAIGHYISSSIFDKMHAEAKETVKMLGCILNLHGGLLFHAYILKQK